MTTKQICEEILKHELNILSAWANNEVYGCKIYYPHFNIFEEKACWGFYTDDHEKSGLLDYARSDIDSYVQKRIWYHFKQLKAWIKYKVPLSQRIANDYS